MPSINVTGRSLLTTAGLILGLCQQGCATEIASAPQAAAVHAVIHVDVAPSQVATALPILQTFASSARQDPAVSSIEILQQTGAPNHFTVIEVIRSEAQYRQFVEQGYVITMRQRLQPLLGSPFDERLHSQIPERGQ
ncbi:quinol monooxygenase YgiN [Pseudomonas sp. JUb42]|jgi:quinol monooxygenase YgiN|uniref:putative quinol monooxygenase n=1 Tax=Pseudomonas sp. JUb42 TaxID=2940611 RepID=UPI002169B1DD|nr:antibiotic biosynthesis monooxygenase [Pseudomonas sp. JUb42]MCS3471464.1 quinol monooxygenase YgiN [Pseudomonas sp. JUb42]